ncbi:hypothetical+protein [Methylocapsa aurea]|uniref:phage major capsid protein n=1 Tax=Methylocapsa aurea TaxID=663610 RepID=UPI003D18BC04
MTERTDFSGLGEWAQAAARACLAHDFDPRLRAPTGASETSATAGGFLLPEAMASEILTTLYQDRMSILNYVRRFNVPDGSAGLKVSGVDETSRANGYRWGGVVADFVDESAPQSPTLPKLKATQYATEKIVGLVSVTQELLADAANLAEFLKAAFVDEIKYKLEQYILSSAGTGAGKPLSILNSSALVKVAIPPAQTPATLTAANLSAMWAALPAVSRRRAIWAIGESAAQMVESVGEISYAESGSANPDDPPRIKGRPVIESDALPAVGAVGDILLIDPAWYGVASKPMATAMSVHVYFANDQIIFRITWRVDARALVSSRLTTSDGAMRSAFVALAARS